jgi:hypothetical protein
MLHSEILGPSECLQHDFHAACLVMVQRRWRTFKFPDPVSGCSRILKDPMLPVHLRGTKIMHFNVPRSSQRLQHDFQRFHAASLVWCNEDGVLKSSQTQWVAAAGFLRILCCLLSMVQRRWCSQKFQFQCGISTVFVSRRLWKETAEFSV